MPAVMTPRLAVVGAGTTLATGARIGARTTLAIGARIGRIGRIGAQRSRLQQTTSQALARESKSRQQQRKRSRR